MKINLRIALGFAAAAVMGLATAASAQNTDTETASGSVTIIRPLTLTKTADLQFGRIVKPATGSATVAIANTADTVDAGTGVALTGITTSRAKFTIDGESAQLINVTVPATMTMTGPSAATLVVTLDPDQVSGVALSGATIGSAGTLPLTIGGSFTLPTAQVTGAYTGTFDVTVAYQ